MFRGSRNAEALAERGTRAAGRGTGAERPFRACPARSAGDGGAEQARNAAEFAAERPAEQGGAEARNIPGLK